MAFCPKCGKTIDQGTFCPDCTPDVLEHKEISIRLCSCGKLFEHGRWGHSRDLSKSIAKIVKESIKQKHVRVEAHLKKTDLKPGKNELTVKAHYNAETYAISLAIELAPCPVCSRNDTQYYEGIIQLRNPKNEVIQYIEESIRKVAAKGIFINKQKTVKNGIDFYVTSQHFIPLLGQKIIRKFGGILKVNAHLQSKNHQTSKDLYRVNVLIHLPEFDKSDVLRIEDEPVKIISLGKQIKGIRLKFNKKLVFDLEKTEFCRLEKHKTRVTKTHPAIEVLHPETYQSTPIQNQTEVSINQEVDVVECNGLFIC